MYPSPGYQPEWATRRHIVAQVYLDIVIAGKPLVLSATERIQILAVEGADGGGYVGALIICCFGNGMRRCDGGDGELGRRHHEPLIGENLGARRGVADQPLPLVGNRGFP